MRGKFLQIMMIFIGIALIGCGRLNNTKLLPLETSSEKKEDTSSLKIEQVEVSLIEKEGFLSNEIQAMLDTTPIRLLPYNIRAQITPFEHHFGELVLKRRITGTYSFQNDSILVKEFFPNILEYTAKDYGRLESKIEYYDSNKVLLTTTDLRNIPLGEQYIDKITFRYHREFITTVTPYEIKADFKEKADSLYVNIQLFSGRNTAYRTVGYHIWGVDENDLIIGYECIVQVLDDRGNPVFQQTFGKPINDAFIHENVGVLCLSFSQPRYSDVYTSDGILLIIDFKTGDNKVNYQAEINEKLNGSLGFQEIQDGFLFFLFGPESGKKTDAVFKIHGLIDFENKKLYKRSLSKQEVESRQKKDINYFKNIDLTEWALIHQF